MNRRTMLALGLGCMIAWSSNLSAEDAPAPAAPAPGAVAPAAEITHSFLATGGHTFIMQVDKENPQGKVVWTYPASTREGCVLADGNVILAVTKGGKYPGGAAVEVTRDNKVVWEYKGTQDELNSVQKTAEGNYVVTESGKKPRLLEIDAAGKVVVEFPLACQKGNSHMMTRMARKLADGTYLAPHLLDFAVKQYDKEGKVLKVIDTKQAGVKETWPFTAIRLPNGNTLCGLTHSNRVAEFDPEGKIVWQITNEEVGGIIKDACGVQRLPNGNTIINSYAAHGKEIRLFEVTPGKKIVWSFKGIDNEGMHNFCVIDTNGVPLERPLMR